MPPRRLSQLLPASCVVSGPDPGITGVSLHSGMVAPGHLFAAFAGSKSDGRQYIAEALHHGAIAVLGPPETQIVDALHRAEIALITCANPRQVFAQVAARFYDQQPRTVAAVTGTSGKSSTVQFLRELWAIDGRRAASLGTIGLIAPHVTQTSKLTTPDTVTLHRDLMLLAENGVTHLAMEASSNALDQYRLDGVQLAAAAFTNLSRDHLDYHADMDDYFMAKARLLTELLPKDAIAVINADDARAPQLRDMIEAAGRRVLSYGTHESAELRLVARTAQPNGQRLTIAMGGLETTVLLPLVGAFQASNALCAAGLAMATGRAPEATIANLSRLSPVRGRLELVGITPNGARVLVDYAHKPGALEAVLTTLRPDTAGQLSLVFGCGGDRDAGKRPIMGEIATRLADRVIITDDNPRSEDPAAIRAAILAAAPSAREFADRAEAITIAIHQLAAGDTLVIAGKGHEQGQTIGDETLPFDDAAVARLALASL